MQPSLPSGSGLQQGSRRSGYIRSDAENSSHRLGMGGKGTVEVGVRGSYAGSGESDIPLHAIGKEKAFYVTEERAVSDEIR